MEVVILSVGLLVFFGHFLADFFQRTKVPDVLILMLAGMVLGPVFHFIEPADFGKVGSVFATLALIIILFEGGIHLNLKLLGAAAGHTLAITLVTFVFTVLVLAQLADWLLQLSFPTALLLGTILGGTSSAVVVPLIRVLRMGDRTTTILFLESALTDVLVIVLALGMIRGLAAGAGGAASLGPGDLAGEIATSFLIAGLIGAAGAFVWSAILDRIRKVPNTVFTTIAYVLILFGITELLGYSGAIAALTFGIAVANFPNISERVLGKVFSFRLSALAEHERAFFAEAVFLVKTFFFVYLGVSIRFLGWGETAIGFALALAVFLARAPIVRVLAPRSTARRDAALMTALVPKGLASAVLATLTVQFGIANAQTIQNTVYSVIFYTIAMSAALIFMVERGWLDPIMGSWFGKYPELPTAPARPEERPPLPMEPVFGLPEIVPEFQEPNPIIDLDGPQESGGGRSDDPESGPGRVE